MKEELDLSKYEVDDSYVESIMAKQRAEESRRARYNNYISDIAQKDEQRLFEIFDKIIQKYESTEYMCKERRCGRYNPDFSLYYAILDYARENGVSSLRDDDFQEEYIIFSKESKLPMYIITSSDCYTGFINFRKVNDDEVIPYGTDNVIKKYTVYGPYGIPIIESVNNPEILNNICFQIKQKKLSGYFVMYVNDCSTKTISTDGKLI